MSFQSPLWLLALALVPLLVVGYVLSERRRASSAERFTNPGLMPNLVDAKPGWRRHLPLAVLLVALAAMIVGVARPHATVSVPREEATVMLAIDASLSMQATDVKPSRLAAARAAAVAFVHEVPSKYRIGIVGFTGRPYLVLPPTRDRALVTRAIASIKSAQGTALGDAVVLAVKAGQNQRTSDGTIPPESILVISDGAQTGGRTSPQQAAENARAHHVPVYAVVLGTQAGVVNVKLVGGYTEQIRVPPQPATLQQLAHTTGGVLFTADTDARLKDVYTHLASRLGRHPVRREVSDLFAGGSAVLLLVGGALSAIWFRRVP